MASELERLPMDADDRESVTRYFYHRALQGLVEGWSWDGQVEPLTEHGAPWGARTRCQRADGVWFQSVYVLASARGQGHLSRYVASAEGAVAMPFVTAPDCGLEGIFEKRGVPYVLSRGFTDRPEYQCLQRHYGNRRAERSGVFYMNHIDEGLAVMSSEGASEAAMRAFVLHPLFQLDDELPRSLLRLSEITSDHRVIVLAMEYRNVANAYLSRREVQSPAEIALGPLPEVAAMLRADKIQNYKDFLLYHRDTHPRREALTRYFHHWFARLGVTTEYFAAWFERLQPGPAKVTYASVSDGGR